MVEDMQHDESNENDNKRARQWNDWDWGWHGSSSWIWGLLFILAGAVLLLQIFYPDMEVINAGNWWVIFIFVPGINMIGRGWHIFRRTGRVWGPFTWGVLLVGFGLSQLFEPIGGQYVWPVLLILGGIALLFGGGKR